MKHCIFFNENKQLIIQVNDVETCEILNEIFLLLAYSNSAINPILYSVSSERFRKKTIICFEFITKGRHKKFVFVKLIDL